MGVGHVIARRPTGRYTIRRVPTRTPVRGTGGVLPPRAGVVDIPDVPMHLQPAGSEDLKEVEGNYELPGWVIYSTTPLQLTSAAYEADRLLVDGEWFKLVKLDPWQKVGGGYCRAVATLDVEQGA